mgnify:CR=1
MLFVCVNLTGLIHLFLVSGFEEVVVFFGVGSNIEPKVNDIAVLHDIIFPF